MKRPHIVLAAACLLLLAAPAGASAGTQIKAVFLQEYALPTYTIDQGALVTFANRDPFLEHAVASDDLDLDDAPLFSAPAIAAGGERLVRGAPFLSEGTYLFHDPGYPEMTATLEVTAEGEPLPPDVIPPTGAVSLRSTTTKAVLGKRRLQLVVNPSEAADIALSAVSAGVEVGTAERTYLSAGKRFVTLPLTKRGARALASKATALQKHRGHRLKLKLGMAISDLAGNRAEVAVSGALKLPRPPKKHKRR